MYLELSPKCHMDLPEKYLLCSTTETWGLFVTWHDLATLPNTTQYFTHNE